MNVWFKAVGIQARIMVGRVFRETGQFFYRKGSKLIGDIAYLENYSRHRTFMPIYELWPSAGKSFVAPNATLCGEVLVGNGCSIWYNAVLRGDDMAIRLGDNVSIGEGSVLQTAMNMPNGLSNGVNIQDHVFVGPNSTVHASTIDSYVYIGAGSTLQPGSRLERGAIVLEGSNVSPNTQIPAMTVWEGNPAVYVRDVTKEDHKMFNEAMKDQAAAAAANQSYLGNLNIKS